MSALLALDPEQRAEVFRVAEQELGLPAHVLEKDFWVTYLLDVLFQQLDLPVRMMFKGGTSLSKCYEVIERFSEDIDLALDREDLGFGGDDAPEAQPSRRKAEDKIKELKAAGTEYVAGTLLPELHQHLEADLAEEFSVTLSEENPDNILFYYPRCLDETSYGDTNYVKPVVLIETGTKAAFEPISEVEIYLLVGQSESVINELPSVSSESTIVPTLGIERTFWEKATILHQQNNCNKTNDVKSRLSRHLYDIAAIVNSDYRDQCMGSLELLEQVANHKDLYYRKGCANYRAACSGELKLVLTPELEEAFREDYDRMSEMFYGDQPDFDEILAELRHIEDHVNQALAEAN